MPVSSKALLDSVLHLPLVLPPVVVGYLPLVSMGRRGFIGQRLWADWFGLIVCLCWRGAVLVSAVMSFPLMVGPFSAGAGGVDIAGTGRQNVGAGRWRVFRPIPTAYPAGHYCRYGAGVARSFGEFGWRDHYLCFHTWAKPAPYLPPCGIPDPDAGGERARRRGCA